MNLSNRIQSLRETNKLSQEELAEKLEVSRQAISKWENGVSKPDINNIVKLSEIYGVTTDFLLTGVEIPKNELEEETQIIYENKKELSMPFKILIVFGGITLIGLIFLTIFPLIIIKILGGN